MLINCFRLKNVSFHENVSFQMWHMGVHEDGSKGVLFKESFATCDPSGQDTFQRAHGWLITATDDTAQQWQAPDFFISILIYESLPVI